MRRILSLVLLALPLSAMAASPCKYEAPRALTLDLAGVRGVQVEVHSHDVSVLGNGTASGLQMEGRACASDKAMLDKLQVTPRREGDQLILDVGSKRGWFSINLFGNAYAYLQLRLALPANMPLTLDVGSGDAHAGNLKQLDSHVGSGDLHVRGITGSFRSSVGSGDVDAEDIGSLQLGSVGSGDVKANGVRGDVHIGSIGSGDVTLHRVGGNVHASTLGSGDLSVKDVQGDLEVSAVGSGDVDHSGVKGKVSVPSDDD